MKLTLGRFMILAVIVSVALVAAYAGPQGSQSPVVGFSATMNPNTGTPDFYRLRADGTVECRNGFTLGGEGMKWWVMPDTRDGFLRAAQEQMQRMGNP